MPHPLLEYLNGSIDSLARGLLFCAGLIARCPKLSANNFEVVAQALKSGVRGATGQDVRGPGAAGKSNQDDEDGPQ